MLRRGIEASPCNIEPLTLAAAVKYQAARRPLQTAVVDAGRPYTYAELERWQGALATHLSERGVKAGGRVALLLPNCIEEIVTIAAASLLGALVIPLNIRYRPDELQYVLEQSRPDAVVLCTRFLTNEVADRFDTARQRTEGGLHVPVLTIDTPVISGSERFPGPDSMGPDAQPPAAVADLDLPFICYWTSGTTGKPKGVVHSSRLLRNVWNWSSMMEYGPEDTFIAARPLYYISGSCWGLFTGLLHGGTIVLGKTLSDTELLTLMADHGVTSMMGGPSLYESLLSSEMLPRVRARLKLRKGFFGGSPIREDFVEAVRAGLGLERVVQIYGMTELQGFATSTVLTDPPAIAQTSVGLPMPGFELSLRDEEGAPVTKPQSDGELWVRGNASFLGYLRPEGPTPATDADGWFKTGDVLAVDGDGRYHYRSRLGNVAKVKGENVSLDEVDGVLMSVPGIRKAVTMAIRDFATGDHLLGVIEVDAEPSNEEIVAFCRERLAPHKVPASLRRVPQGFDWPLTVTGKVRRKDLEAMLTGT